MARIDKLFTAVFLAVIYTSSLAVPMIASSKHATHRRRTVSSGLELETFHPPSTYLTYEKGIDHPSTKRADFSLEDAAVNFVVSQLKVDPNTVKYKSGFKGESAQHAYVKQSHEGIDFANAVASVAFNHNNKVVAFGNCFVTPQSIASSTPTLLSDDAIAAAEKALGGKYNDHPTTLEYLAMEDGTAALVHVVQVQDDESGSWVEGFVDAHSGKVLSITDFTAKASYRALNINKQYLTQGFDDLTDPQDYLASPLGWHDTGSGNSKDTSGNNAVSFKGSHSATSKETSPILDFYYIQNPNVEPTEDENVDVARVNSFYIVNSMHDIAYRYGFTEAAFNFQNNNFNEGGRGNDRVNVSVQDASGENNANFATPPDGQSGRMRMYLFNITYPGRDGALENDIVVHEFTHGITNRMTGGGTSRCLQTTESGGLGEGWSDAMAEWTETISGKVTDYITGKYVTNSTEGARSHPYSTSPITNPLRYSSLAKLDEVHDIGEVWANMLHNVYAVLVEAHGWSANSFKNPYGLEGNIVFLHLFIDALPIQPCNPTFVQARQAWIQADENRYGGANRCILWKAFASRGLGVNAAKHKDDETIPKDCY